MSRPERSRLLDRRSFLYVTAITASSFGCSGLSTKEGSGDVYHFEIDRLLGGLRSEPGTSPVEGATWYVADSVDDGMLFRFPAGTLGRLKYITTDMMLDGNQMNVFIVRLKEGEDGRTFVFRFAGLNQCGFRVRFPLDLTDQGRWGIEREAAFLKPRCSGDRVDLDKVDRMEWIVFRKGPEPARWCMTPVLGTVKEVPLMEAPVLPKGPLLDRIGQSRIHEWPAKTAGLDELKTRLETQLKQAPGHQWPESFSRWGGWKAKKFGKGTGFFSTAQDDNGRWWLQDPDGYGFWSMGVDCVRVDTTARYDGLETALEWVPEQDPTYREALQGSDSNTGKYVNYLATNFIQTFGAEGWRDRWAEIALGELKRLRFNTVGNWSEWNYARKATFPYVRPMSFRPHRAGLIYRDFPDVYHPQFKDDVADYAAELAETRDDPALIGYFLMNEPTWGFSSELPAEGMLYNTPECHTRGRLVEFLKERYPDAAAISKAWSVPTSYDEIGSGHWKHEITPAAKADLEAFSVLLVEDYFKALSEGCRAVDPNHLNLGMRWAGVPPSWAVKGMKAFDVFSLNCYLERLPKDQAKAIHDQLGCPVMVGEWHFGALDVGLPSSGIGHLKNQEERGKAYRVYIEDAAANPYCVGVHWFTLYDESALGRFDGENYNIGFLDVCNRPYEELSEAGRTSHERLYEVVSGKAEPFDVPLEYLPKLY